MCVAGCICLPRIELTHHNQDAMDFFQSFGAHARIGQVGMAVAVAFLPLWPHVRFSSPTMGWRQVAEHVSTKSLEMREGQCEAGAMGEWVACDRPLVVQAAKSPSNAVILTFQMEGEFPADLRFFVERSPDGEVFEQIGVLSRANAQMGGWYHFVDLRPRHGHNFYRVRMPCPEGTVYSNVVHVENFFGLEQFVLYPNPTDGVAYVELRGAFTSDSQIVVRAATQGVVFSDLIPRAAYRYRLDLAALPEGVYFVQIMYNNMQGSRTFRLIKR